MQSDLHTSVAWACIGSHLAVEVVFDHDNFLTAIWVSSQNALNCGVRSLTFSSSNVPPTNIQS